MLTVEEETSKTTEGNTNDKAMNKVSFAEFPIPSNPDNDMIEQQQQRNSTPSTGKKPFWRNKRDASVAPVMIDQDQQQVCTCGGEKRHEDPALCCGLVGSEQQLRRPAASKNASRIPQRRAASDCKHCRGRSVERKPQERHPMQRYSKTLKERNTEAADLFQFRLWNNNKEEASEGSVPPRRGGRRARGGPFRGRSVERKPPQRFPMMKYRRTLKERNSEAEVLFQRRSGNSSAYHKSDSWLELSSELPLAVESDASSL